MSRILPLSIRKGHIDDGLYKRSASIYWQSKYEMYDGVIRFNNFFVNVKEKTLIGSAYGVDVDFQQ
ncbi:MAG: hypothetical protein NC313_12660 [Butyrivibrio sp.]|nr:hypothetical protein [Butyrivibrio sp.]